VGIGALVILAAALLQSGCGGETCGTGTVSKDGVCVAADDVLTCGPGFNAVANKCEPSANWVKVAACGDNTEYDPTTGKCKGTGSNTQDTCTKKCPQPQGSKICLAGRVLDAVDVMGGVSNPTPIKKDAKVTIGIYDPVAYVSNPDAPPITTTSIYADDGCFIVESIDVPFSGFFMIGVDDDPGTSLDIYVAAAVGETPVFNQNSMNLVIPAVKTVTANAWGNDLVKDGVMIMWFRKKGDGGSVDGVTPTLENQAPPWTGMSVFFFDKDITTAPYFDMTTKVTTTTGLVAVRKAQMKTFSGTKSGCKIEAGSGGATPGTIFFRIFDVEGC